jgi:hypothetical protein
MGHRHQQGNGQLADGQGMTARPNNGQEIHQIVDVIVQVESTFPQGHLRRIAPIGDVDIVVGQHDQYGIPQQGREMAAQGCHDQ